MADNMTFTRDTLKLFKRAYAVAVAKNKDQFTFEGKQFLVSYAKYLIEYLENQLH